MDFKRIELIFLAAFFSLNIFLLFTYYQNNVEATPVSETTNFSNIEKRLKEEKITYDKDFSERIYEGYYLSGVKTDFSKVNNKQLMGQLGRVENDKLVSTFQQNKQLLISKKDTKAELQKFIQKEKNIIDGKDYIFLKTTSEPPLKYVFAQGYAGIPINDETSDLSLSLEETEQNKLFLRGYSQKHIEELEPLRESQELISERDAIITLYMSNKISKEAKIKTTQLAYTRIFSVRGKNVYIPAWFVSIENKNNVQLERVNAFTNSIISSNVPEVKK